MLFQPTSITPDHLGALGNGIVDLTNDFSVSWMVNGNSPLVAFQINFYTNTAASYQVYTTGKLTTGCPFYGTDSKGNKQFFTYTDTSRAINGALGNMNTTEFKFVIVQWWSETEYVTQTSPSAFTIKSSPSLYLNTPSVLEQMSYTFTATYSQAEGDALNWVRWQIAANTEEGRENPLYDSGNIYGTALLECYYDGFLTGTSYCVKVSIETASGVQKSTEWTSFMCDYELGSLVGTVTAEVAECQKPAVKVTWGGSKYIYGVPTGDYEISDGLLKLPIGSTVTWNTASGSPMSIPAEWNVLYKGTVLNANAQLLTVTCGTVMTLSYSVSTQTLTFKRGTTTVASLSSCVPNTKVTVIITPSRIYIRRDRPSGGLYPSSTTYPSTTTYPKDSTGYSATLNNYAMSYTQNPITAITVGGEQECDYVQVINGTLDSSIIAAAYTNGTYVADTVDGTYFLAAFDGGDLNAGTLYINGTRISGWSIYRQQKDNGIMMHLANLETYQNVLYDYNACSQQGGYTYYVYPIGTDKFVTSALVSNAIYPTFWNWAILECSFDENDGYYTVQNEFLFGKNLDSGTLSNNNQPNILDNFTRYPLVQISPKRYMSGTLQSLIGTICMGEYTDTIYQREAIDALSNTTNDLFLKNRKGDLWAIRISDAITYEIMDNTVQQATSASISWVQVADAKEASIIQISQADIETE